MHIVTQRMANELLILLLHSNCLTAEHEPLNLRSGVKYHVRQYYYCSHLLKTAMSNKIPSWPHAKTLPSLNLQQPTSNGVFEMDKWHNSRSRQMVFVLLSMGPSAVSLMLLVTVIVYLCKYSRPLIFEGIPHWWTGLCTLVRCKHNNTY